MTTPSDLTDFLCTTLALACHRNADALTPAITLADLNVDSLTLVAVLAQVEAVFTVTLTDDDTIAMFEAVTIADLSERIARLLRSR
ncbi:MAG: acyl carrier protein [Gammaproteobacteria bacterium]|nr:acyl carrier protein [Gammaproteobacteria bacterium]